MPPVTASGVAANGLRYEMCSANGQSFLIPVADCPAASCQNVDNVARFGLSPEDQARVRDYDAALNKQTAKGVTTIAVGAAAAPLVAEGIVANALLGGAVSGTFSAKDQYIDDGKINAGKTGRDAVIGAAATGVAAAAVPVIAAGAKAWGQTLDEVVAAKVVSQAEVDAAALQAGKVGNNFGREADLIRTPRSKEEVAELIAEHSKQVKSAANASPLTQDGAKSILNEINPPGTTAKVMGDNAVGPDIHIINSANGELVATVQVKSVAGSRGFASQIKGDLKKALGPQGGSEVIAVQVPVGSNLAQLLGKLGNFSAEMVLGVAYL